MSPCWPYDGPDHRRSSGLPRSYVVITHAEQEVHYEAFEKIWRSVSRMGSSKSMPGAVSIWRAARRIVSSGVLLLIFYRWNSRLAHPFGGSARSFPELAQFLKLHQEFVINLLGRRLEDPVPSRRCFGQLQARGIPRLAPKKFSLALVMEIEVCFRQTCMTCGAIG
jgi:hypothetical protein